MNEILDERGKFAKGHKKVGGRTKGTGSLNDEIRKILENQIEKNFPEFVDNPQFVKKKAKVVLAQKMIGDAIKGNTLMQMHINNQIDGRAKQQIDVGGTDTPIQINVKHIKPDTNDE